LGNGVRMSCNQVRSTGNPAGKDRHLNWIFRIEMVLKKKVRGSDYTREIKNPGINHQVENIKIILSLKQSAFFNKLCSFTS
jgi:hypothetical protein